MAIETKPRPTVQSSTLPEQRGPDTRQPVQTRPDDLRGRLAVPERVEAAKAARPNIALAGLQLLVGYEWLVGGVDKLLFGLFPDQLGGLLAASLNGGHLPGFFAALLRALVAPNAAFFGVLIEWSETLAGLGLMVAGLVALLRPLVWPHLSGRAAALFRLGDRLLEMLSPLAAAGAGLLGLSFFFLDGLPSPWFAPGIAYGGAIDTGLFLAAASVVVVLAQLAQRRRAR